MADADPNFRAEQDDETRPSAEDAPARRKPWWRWPLRIIGGLLAAVFLAWLVLYITKGRFLREPFERIVSRQIEREVRVGGDFQLYLDWFNIKFVADELSVANPSWRGGQFWTSKHIDTRIRTWSLIRGKRELMWLNLDGARVDLAWNRDRTKNTWTFGDPNKPAEPFEMPHIERVAVVDTRLNYRDPLLQLLARVNIQTIKGTDTRVEDDIRATGDGTLRGRPFQFTASLLSPNETIAGGRNRLTARATAARGIVVTVDGTLPGATVIDGADLRVTARGQNISDLLEFIGVVTPPTRAYRLRANLTKQENTYRFTRLTGRFGESDIAGRFTVSMPNNRVKMDADLRTRSLDIADAGLFFGWDAARVERTGTAVETVGGTPRILPDAPLRVDAIKAFDADVRYRVARIAARNVPVSDIDLTLDLERSLLQLKPLTFTLSGGRVWSDIEINARRPAVVTSYDVKLSPTPMGRLLGRFGVEESGTTGTISARINMTGTGDSIRRSLASSNGRIAVVMPQGTFWTRNVQLAELDIGTFIQKMFEKKLKEPVQINCGLIAFTVRNGIAAADPILIDTQKNVILGRGGFSFRTEALDLAVRADGKKFSLFSGQSPVGINGYFARPGFDVISPQLVGRAGAGLGLAIVASPLAGVLAFVDVGDAKSAACGPVLAGAKASAQRTTKGKARDDVGRGTTAKSESGKTSKEGRQEQRKKFLGIF